MSTRHSGTLWVLIAGTSLALAIIGTIVGARAVSQRLEALRVPPSADHVAAAAAFCEAHGGLLRVTTRREDYGVVVWAICADREAAARWLATLPPAPSGVHPG